MKRKHLLLGLLILVMGGVFPVTANAAGSVNGSALWYCNKSSLTTAVSHAVSTWNALSKVSITNQGCTWTDLEFQDANQPSASWTGQYTPYAFTRDYIQLNLATISSDTNRRKNTATHELGHALGIGHTSTTGNVMLTYQTTQTWLGSWDTAQYSSFYP
ncbi:MAG TPA: matrixin family metalloprotease [Roseiflexaceae bacterium]|nr:matrixin family metalloprotease [Roseiflexaceae bacterium]